MNLLSVLLVIGFTTGTNDAAAAESNRLDPTLRQQAGKALDRAVGYMRRNQNEDGSFGEAENGPAITGLAVASLLRTKRVTVADPMISRAMAYLEKYVQADGGIYPEGGRRNYSTAICVLAFVEANKDGRYQTVVDKAVALLKTIQWDEGEGITEADHKYGGAGYGSHSRPDLSNTGFLLEALHASGLPKDDPAFQRALRFVTRCQNLSGEGANDLPQAALINDGGIAYTPTESKAGGTVNQGLRSYGSMTYTGLKSFIYAGLDKKDRRVQAALGWIKKNYTLESNPGMGQQGLYYYFHTFAKALDVLEVDAVVDDRGVKHEWRTDLLRKLVAVQRTDGSWANANQRWFEGNPRLVTSYALLAISHALE